MSNRPRIYVLSWYPDGSGKPEIKFFDGADGIKVATYAAEQAENGRRTQVGPVVVQETVMLEDGPHA